MRIRLTKVVAGLAAIAALALGGSALASATQKAPSPKPPAAPVQQEKATADTDAVQDENGADDATEAAESEQSEAAESESAEAPGDDGPGGHADEPGNPNADHQFEGEE